MKSHMYCFDSALSGIMGIHSSIIRESKILQKDINDNRTLNEDIRVYCQYKIEHCI